MTTLIPGTQTSSQHIAVALTLAVADPRDHLAALATLLQQFVPAHTRVLALTGQDGGVPTRVTHLCVTFGPCRYRLRVDAGSALSASRWLLHGVTCTAAETLPLELWIEFLAVEITFAALGSPIMRRAVERLAA